MKALVTAGGHGTRLRPITHTKNKHLIPIANRPMLLYALENVASAGIREVGVIVNEGDDEITDFFGDGSFLGLRLTYIPQDAPRGLAHVIRIAEPFIGQEPFVFYLGDNILVGGIRRFIEEFEGNGSNCHLVLSEVPDPQRFGVPEIHNGAIVSVEEKPSSPKSRFAVTGIYFYDRNVFDAVRAIRPSAREELEISDAHDWLIRTGRKVSYSVVTGWWKDTGKVEDLLEANRLVLHAMKSSIAGECDSATTIVGAATVGEGTRIARASIQGPVVIGRNAVVEDAYIGPYTAIADGCVIRKCEIEYSIVMESSRIENVSGRIAGSLVGHEVSIAQSPAAPRVHRFLIGDQCRVTLS